mmetsp:Transcript_35001/g.103682  ORF Transcript_35001/g.103682 Transcript_35001/m.103682 type:complete len:220 (-) Transcript_35001:649-1308(-)
MGDMASTIALVACGCPVLLATSAAGSSTLPASAASMLASASACCGGGVPAAAAGPACGGVACGCMAAASPCGGVVDPGGAVRASCCPVWCPAWRFLASAACSRVWGSSGSGGASPFMMASRRWKVDVFWTSSPVSPDGRTRAPSALRTSFVTGMPVGMRVTLKSNAGSPTVGQSFSQCLPASLQRRQWYVGGGRLFRPPPRPPAPQPPRPAGPPLPGPM